MHLPEQIESERLIIRVARPGDGKLFNQAITESLDHLSPWLAWVTPPPTIEESEESCRRAYGRFHLNEDLMVFFFTKDCGSLIGGSGLHDVDWELGRFEVGYWGRTSFCGRGLITEGVRSLSRHALDYLGASRVFLTTDDLNTASWRLAERAGFELEGTIRNDRRNLHGNLRNTRVYSIIQKGEQGSPQSATRSDSEGGDKPQPKSEGGSR
ncbi:GNAT family N-acetyltransferase [Haloferula sargassicola]|uniref:Ribosomal N-acetyltransferase YdaF n=1 Tax=Haloferula sargassicola TaxID=490096 RepID=A0ABP9UK99_9BACT